MSPIPFLLLALGLSAVGTVLVWLIHRKPESVERDVSSFAGKMAALSPARAPQGGTRRPTPPRPDSTSSP
jgi:hypothetical protein